MKLIAQIKLQPTPAQADALRRTLEQANAACNDISEVAWEQQRFGKYDLQQLTYYRIKDEYELSAQMAIRCLAKVGDSYKLDRAAQCNYRHTAALPTTTESCRSSSIRNPFRSGRLQDEYPSRLLPVSRSNGCFSPAGARVISATATTSSTSW